MIVYSPPWNNTYPWPGFPLPGLQHRSAVHDAIPLFTMDVYGHVSKKMDKSAAEKLKKYISTL